jgi:hypothetical protein
MQRLEREERGYYYYARPKPAESEEKEWLDPPAENEEAEVTTHEKAEACQSRKAR